MAQIEEILERARQHCSDIVQGKIKGRVVVDVNE